MSATGDLPLNMSWFPTAMPDGPAIGDQEHTTWGTFVARLETRQEGTKDGPNFVPATFTLEPDGRHVRRLKRNLVARTAVALDCETNKHTGELPPSLGEVATRIRHQCWAAVIYTSHNHTAEAPRYRIVLPLSEEIAPNLPAVEVVADQLQLLGVLDGSKVGASSLFYLPSSAPGQLDRHETLVIDGPPIHAAWMRDCAGEVLAQRQAEAERITAEAHAEATARRKAKIAAGFDPDNSLIEKLRSRFDLEGVLLAHGYDKAGSKSDAKYRHPNSSSGSFGADIKILGGIERVFSHNGTDPLHRDNLPQWCAGVTALDVVDVVIILDFAGDRKRALKELAQRFGITKAAEHKVLAKLIFRMARGRDPQETIEAAAFAEGKRLGMSRVEIVKVANWCVTQLREAA